MTAKELIEELSKLDPETEVYKWNNDNYMGHIGEIFELEWKETKTHPVVNGEIKTETIKVPVLD